MEYEVYVKVPAISNGMIILTLTYLMFQSTKYLINFLLVYSFPRLYN